MLDFKENFKKGEKVRVIRTWDDKGTVYTQDFIVHSCGKKELKVNDSRNIGGNTYYINALNSEHTSVRIISLDDEENLEGWQKGVQEFNAIRYVKARFILTRSNKDFGLSLPNDKIVKYEDMFPEETNRRVEV